MGIWHKFYNGDIRPHLLDGFAVIRGVFLGPPGREMNGYERLGRTLAGIGVTALMLALYAFMIVFFLTPFVWLVRVVYMIATR